MDIPESVLQRISSNAKDKCSRSKQRKKRKENRETKKERRKRRRRKSFHTERLVSFTLKDSFCFWICSYCKKYLTGITS